MAEFLDTQNLKIAIKELFRNAETHITIISPYIKLDDKIKSMLSGQISNPKFKIKVMFGKNEENKSRSVKHEDIEFFKQFQNVKILYLENLHAKYYANEVHSIITSMNLHTYSRENNVEVGVLFKPLKGAGYIQSISKSLTKDYNADEEAFNYFYEMIDEAELIFHKLTAKKKKLISLKKEYEEPIIEKDITEKFFNEFSKKVDLPIQGIDVKNPSKTGFCIRTREEIPFNIDKPLSSKSLKTWSQFGDPSYKESYCHYSGEETDGEICFSKPVLPKYWKQALELHRELNRKFTKEFK